jgi:ribosome-associated protein
MQAKKMQQLVSKALDDAKGEDIQVLDVRKLADFADYLVIASGTSSRHVSSMADKVIDKMREAGVRPLGVEGQDGGEWVLIDFGDVVAHVMRPQTRELYALEKLWGSDLREETELVEKVRRTRRARK